MTVAAPERPATGSEIDKSPGRVRRLFDRITPRYDLLNHLLSFQVDRLWRRRAARSLMRHGPRRILDLCTGTGDLAIACAKRGGESCRVVGVDFAIPMLAEAARKRDVKQIEWIRLAAGDALRLPFPDDTFDAATVAFGARNFTDLDIGLAEMARVVRPGGTVQVLEFVSDTAWWMRPFYRFHLRWILPLLGRTLSGSDAYRYLSGTIRAFLTTPALAGAVERAGCRDVTSIRWTGGISALIEGSVR